MSSARLICSLLFASNLALRGMCVRTKVTDAEGFDQNFTAVAQIQGKGACCCMHDGEQGKMSIAHECGVRKTFFPDFEWKVSGGMCCRWRWQPLNGYSACRFDWIRALSFDSGMGYNEMKHSEDPSHCENGAASSSMSPDNQHLINEVRLRQQAINTVADIAKRGVFAPTSDLTSAAEFTMSNGIPVLVSAVKPKKEE